MNKKKQLLFTITGILLICILFSTAMIFPKYFNSYRDSQILNKTEYINVNNDMYEVSYTSFADKLNAIAKCQNFGIELHSVKIDDTGHYPPEPNYIGIIIFNDSSTLTIEGTTFTDSSALTTDKEPAMFSDNLYIKIGINWGDIQ